MTELDRLRLKRKYREVSSLRDDLRHELELLADERRHLLEARRREVERARREMIYGPIDPVGTRSQQIAPEVNAIVAKYRRELDENEIRSEEIRKELDHLVDR